MHMTSIGKKTWCQRVRAAIILEGAILLVAAFILWRKCRIVSINGEDKLQYGNRICVIGRRGDITCRRRN